MLDFEDIDILCSECDRCELCKKRTNAVVGGGATTAEIMFVGEAPGEQEDLQGRVFVGPAGQLLDKMLSSINLSRENVYLTNIVKCRPPKNRDPKKDEQQQCLPYLRWQFKLVHPKILVCLGRIAAQALIKDDFRISSEHGKWIERKGCFMIATYHPSALLRYPEHKKEAYSDLLEIKKKIEELNIKLN